LGLENHPNLYIAHLIEIFTEIKRVLKRTGTLWVNMGDSYYGSGCGYGSKPFNQFGSGELYNTCKKPSSFGFKSNWLQPQQLLGIPERFMIAMQESGFILHNKIIWKKKNPMPFSGKKRFANTWEYMFYFVKNIHHFFDLDAVREPHKQVSLERLNRGVSENNKWIDGPNRQTKHTMSQPRPNRNKTKDESYKIDGMRNAPEPNEPNAFHPAGKNPGDCFDAPEDYWELSTQGFKEAHFATFPEKLIIKPILAGCPEQICSKCGKIRERISEYEMKPTRPARIKNTGKSGQDTDPNKQLHTRDPERHILTNIKTVGFTKCDCNAPFEPGVVLDIFGGAGTVGVVALKNNRNFILIDAKQEYCEMAERRLQPIFQSKKQGRLELYGQEINRKTRESVNKI